MNPFEAPPKPPKRYESVASVKPKNPFDDEAEEETVTFHTLHRSTDHHATRSPMCSERHQSTTHANRSEQRVLNGKRTFGGSIQPASAQSNGGRPDSLLSKAREQFKRVSAGVSNQRDSSNYSALSTHSGRSTPLLPHARDIESQQQDSTRSPLAPVSPVGPPLKDTSSEAQNSNKSTFSNQGIRQNRSKAAAPEPCDNSSDSDEEDGLQLTDVGLRNGSMNSRNSTSSTNSTNSTRSSERVSSTRSKDMTRASEQSRPAGNDSTPGKKKVKKQRKAKVRKTIFCVDPHDENAVVRHLISGRVYGYPHTYGGRLSNFRYYVQYNHPLLSIYFTHPLHPFSRRQRFIVFLCALSFAVCFSFILMATPLVPVFATCRSVCHCEIVTDDTTSAATAAAEALFSSQTLFSSDFAQPSPWEASTPFSSSSAAASAPRCVGGDNDGKECEAYHAVCDNYHSWMLSCFCGAMTTVYDSLLRFLATCSCLQGRSLFQNNCLGVRFKALVEYFGSVTLLFFSAVSAFFTLFTMALCWYQDIAAEVLFVMLLSELWAIGQWIVWSAPWFLYKYRSDRKKFYDKLRRRSSRHRGDAIADEV